MQGFLHTGALVMPMCREHHPTNGAPVPALKPTWFTAVFDLTMGADGCLECDGGCAAAVGSRIKAEVKKTRSMEEALKVMDHPCIYARPGVPLLNSLSAYGRPQLMAGRADRDHTCRPSPRRKQGSSTKSSCRVIWC